MYAIRSYYAAVLARQHRTARDGDRRQVDARRAHQQRGRGFVAADEQDDAIERIGANRFLDVHAREIPVQHCGRAQQRLAERHHRKLDREAAGLEHARAHMLGNSAEVRIVGHQLRVGVADADSYNFV